MLKPKHFTTHIDLAVEVREKSIALLNQQLADTFDLYSQTKQAHWNVKGSQFYQLHLLFDQLAGTLEEPIDKIAERITALGGIALGTARMAAAASKLPEYPVEAVEGRQHVEALVLRWADVAKSTRAAIDATTDAGDAVSADLFTQLGGELDKNLWFLEAHLQS